MQNGESLVPAVVGAGNDRDEGSRGRDTMRMCRKNMVPQYWNRAGSSDGRGLTSLTGEGAGREQRSRIAFRRTYAGQSQRVGRNARTSRAAGGLIWGTVLEMAECACRQVRRERSAGNQGGRTLRSRRRGPASGCSLAPPDARHVAPAPPVTWSSGRLHSSTSPARR